MQCMFCCIFYLQQIQEENPGKSRTLTANVREPSHSKQVDFDEESDVMIVYQHYWILHQYQWIAEVSGLSAEVCALSG